MQDTPLPFQEQEENITDVDIYDEMKQSFLDYAMSVIVARAIPDVRDGLKPVHRRILYSMYDLNNTPDKAFKKSARIVGECMGKYHPHGDSSVYDAMVRLAQPFSTRCLLVDGQGNFGSVDNDPPAAMRYTEARLTHAAMEMLADIECNTVDFVPNFDATLQEPVVMPSAIPNLLVNGSTGIAVGMATNIPPHNLREVVDACVALIENNDLDDEDLLQYIQGPDFPTGGILLKNKSLSEVYTTGRGSVVVRGVVRMETNKKTGRCTLVVDEIPYMVNKQSMVENIAALVQEKRIEGIADLRDESDRSGMRVVIELKRDASPKIVLNNLYKHTQLQQNFTFMMLTLVNSKPCLLSLKEMLTEYLTHRFSVVSRRTQFFFKKASARDHILQGFLVVLDDLSRVIDFIRNSDDAATAIQALCENFTLSNEQAAAVLDMPLRRLTGLEKKKLETEHLDLMAKITDYTSLLENPSLVYEKIKTDLLRIKDKYGDKRRTVITIDPGEISSEDLIPDEPMAVFITNQGYIKRIPIDTFEKQKRGGVGVGGMKTREEDFIKHFFVCTNHSYVMFFTNKGLSYRLKVYELPEASRQAKGSALVNLLDLKPGEVITAVVPVPKVRPDMDKEYYFVMLTKKGIIKRVSVPDFFRSGGKRGLIAIALDEDDELGWVCISDGSQNLIIATVKGKAAHFSEKLVRAVGRSARGVIGITLRPDDSVVGFTIAAPEKDLLTVATNGYGKRTKISEYSIRLHRGSQGIGNIVLKKGAKVASILEVCETDEVLVVTSNGKVIRQKVSEISQLGRTTQGVRLQKMDKGDCVVAVAPVALDEDKEEEVDQPGLLPVDSLNTDVPTAQTADEPEEDEEETDMSAFEDEDIDEPIEDEESDSPEIEE